MMRAPALAAIHAAELRVAQAERNSRDSLRRVRVAFRAALVRPSTLALVAGAAGLFGFWLARRPQPQPQPQATASTAGATATTSAIGLVLAFMVRYGLQRLPNILQQVWAARQKRAGRFGPAMSKSPAAGYSATNRHEKEQA
jgi:hypothetical protein